MKISILGLGWFGAPLAETLVREGISVSGTTRSEEKRLHLKASGINAEIMSYPELPSSSLLGQDIVILNVPPFEEQLTWFQRWEWDLRSWVIFVSSTSVYPAPTSRSAELLKAQEDWISGTFQQWTILRFGGLIGGARHPGKYLAGRKNLPGGDSPVNLIHLEDTIGATLAVIKARAQGKIFHVVSDEHPTRRDFYTDYCKGHGLPLPEFNPTDTSSGKIVPNDDLRSLYIPCRSLRG